MSRSEARDRRLTKKARKAIGRRIKGQWTGTPVSLMSVLEDTEGYIEAKHFERAASEMVRAGILGATDDPDIYIPKVPGRSVTR